MSEATNVTTRKQLVALAQENSVPGTKELLTAIEEANQQLQFAAKQLSQRSQAALQQTEAKSYETVGSFVKEASDYETAAGKLNTLTLTLACVLQNAGVRVEY